MNDLKKRLPLLLYLMLLVAACGGKESVLLEIDFSEAPSWLYLLGADLRGAVECEDSSQAYSGSLRAYLQGAGSSTKESAQFKTKDFTIKSDFLTDGQMFELENRLSVLEIAVSPTEGVSVSDTAIASAIPLANWDILRSVARAIPVLPASKMSVGASWEREYQFPIETNQGQVTGQLYQIFRLDSIITKNANPSRAILSWLFSYRVSLDHINSVVGDLPMSGSGVGNAVIDLKKNRLIKTNANFEMSYQDRCNIQLKETVHLELIE